MIDRQDNMETERNVQDQEETLVVEGEEMAGAAGAEGEAWQDELPPEDDFQDIQAAEGSEGDAFGEESVDEAPVDDPYGLQGSKKRGKAIFWGIVGVGALFIGGMAFLQFAPSGVETPSVLPMAAVLDVQQIKKGYQTDSSGGESYSVTPKTGETDLSTLYKTAQQQGASGTLALPSGEPLQETADKTALGTSTEIMTDEPPPSSPSSPPSSSSVPAVAKIEDIPVSPLHSGAVSEKTAPAAAAVAPSSLAPKAEDPALAAATERLRGMGEEVDALKKELDKALQANLELVKKLEETQKGDIQAETRTMHEKVSQLEQELAEAKAGQMNQKTAKKELNSPVLHENSGLFVTETAPLPKTSKATAKKKKKTKTISYENKRPAPTTPWVLRAATPDAAWVSTSSHAAELRRVAVGESLSGIGKIVEIRQNGDIWEVVGSSGTLR